MEQLVVAIKGVLAGLVLSAPLGPVALLCVRRSMLYGPLAGLASGLGAAVADMFYAAIAAFGLTVIAEWLERNRAIIDLVGGITLVVIGLYFLFAPAHPTPEAKERQLERVNAPRAFVATFALTLSNPITLVTFIVLFDTLRAGGLGSQPLSAAILVGGVFAGSMVWWLTLSFGGGRFAGRLAGSERLLNRICGLVMIGFGAYALLHVI